MQINTINLDGKLRISKNKAAEHEGSLMFLNIHGEDLVAKCWARFNVYLSGEAHRCNYPTCLNGTKRYPDWNRCTGCPKRITRC